MPSQTAALRVINGVTDIYIGEFDDGQFFDRSRSLNPDTDLMPAIITTLDVDLQVPLVGQTTANIDIKARSHTKSESNETTLYFAAPLPDTQSTDPQGASISALAGNLVDNLEVSLGVRGGGDNGLDPVLSALGIGVDTLLETLQPALDTVIDDVVIGAVEPLLSGIVDSAIGSQLGVGIGSASFTMIGIGAYCETIGEVYLDQNLNNDRENGEPGPGVDLFVKAIPLNGGDAAVAAVDPDTGTYNLGYQYPGQYRLILDDNDNLSDLTPSLPPGYLNTEQDSGEQIHQVNGGRSPQDFGIFRGSRIDLYSFIDTGSAPNNGVPETDESGLNDARITIVANDQPIANGRTNSNGELTLYVPHDETIELLICQEDVSGFYDSGGQPIESYDASTNCVTSVLEPGAQLTNEQRITFSNIPVSRFAASGRQAAPAGGTIDYQHQFTAGTDGSISIDGESNWSTIYLADDDCDGLADGEQVLMESTPMAAGETLCFVARVSVPEDAVAGNRDPLVLTANFSPTNIDSITESLTLTDLSYAIDGNGDGGITLEKSSDKQQASPGETITYRLSYSNLTDNPISEIVINDALPAWTTLEEASCTQPMPSGLTDCNVATGGGSDGSGVSWQLPGTLQPGESGAVEFRVRLEP